MTWYLAWPEVIDELADAVYALEELAAGRTPDRARLLAGALALDTLALRGATDREFLDAARANSSPRNPTKWRAAITSVIIAGLQVNLRGAS